MHGYARDLTWINFAVTTMPSKPDYLWVVLRHDCHGSQYDREWDDGHKISVVSIHNNLKAANRCVMEETREEVSAIFEYDFPEEGESDDVVGQDQGDMGRVYTGKHGCLVVSTSEDTSNATKVWVERGPAPVDASDDEDEEEDEEDESTEEDGSDANDNNSDVVFVGIKRKNGTYTEATTSRPAKKANQR